MDEKEKEIIEVSLSESVPTEPYDYSVDEVSDESKNFPTAGQILGLGVLAAGVVAGLHFWKKFKKGKKKAESENEDEFEEVDGGNEIEDAEFEEVSSEAAEKEK